MHLESLMFKKCLIFCCLYLGFLSQTLDDIGASLKQNKPSSVLILPTSNIKCTQTVFLWILCPFGSAGVCCRSQGFLIPILDKSRTTSILKYCSL